MSITRKCRAVANYIIEETNKFNEDKTLREQAIMSGKRLQKILYLCNVEFMMLHNGEPLFEDYFFSWPSGPVIPSIYHIFIQHQNGKMFPRYDVKSLELTAEEKNIIDKVLRETQKLNSRDLINITNINGGPWQRFYNEYDPDHNQIIPKEEIYNFHLNKEITNQTQEEKVSTLVKKRIPSKNTENK